MGKITMNSITSLPSSRLTPGILPLLSKCFRSTFHSNGRPGGKNPHTHTYVKIGQYYFLTRAPYILPPFLPLYIKEEDKENINNCFHLECEKSNNGRETTKSLPQASRSACKPPVAKEEN